MNTVCVTFYLGIYFSISLDYKRVNEQKFYEETNNNFLVTLLKA